jgi:DNA-binding response OmpR family regulator
VKILIVDDDREFVSLLIEVLSPNHQVVGITSGERVTDWVKNTGCELILLDILLPDNSGLALVQQIKQAYPHVFVMLMSGLMPGLTGNQVRSAGADAFMAKPISLRRLLTAIEDLAGSAPA